mgnify:CR=1 FL=1
MANFLVTGGAGFIGSNLVDYLLQEGHAVRVLDNLATGRRENLAHVMDRIEFMQGDLRDKAACEEAARGMDYVLHQGAVPSVPRSVADPLLSNEANVTGTVNLLVAARDAGVKRLVFASSSSVYGDQQADVKSEDLPLNPLSPYAATKAAGEHYLRSFSLCYGVETVSLRYFNVFGPRQDPSSPYSAVIPLFITAMLEGRRPIVHGDGLQARDFTFVGNNVRANVLAATASFDAKGQAYNIACGDSITLLDLVCAINETLGTDIQPEFAPRRVGDVRVSKADISRAKADMGYEVSVDFAEGIKRTIEWYRRNTNRESR